ncbi:class I SAM-dependent methyltransferase [Ottowia thiooxydans]|uniref:class I SAM-dependent methyltransferase n=1 Tax=Ottowia thiooxydans TaxID=219182 RepID=UPI000429FB85|nr:class I SAM-dependent methyltransferase [Ottowia thiooxydans]
MSSIDFYRAFEERYRGSRELIRKRQEAYLPFIEPLRAIYQPTTAVDLGCGRGEWLELLQGAGFQAEGVDLDAGMLAACTELGLSVNLAEAVAHLESLGDESQCIVSGFHIVEHISFDQLQALVMHSLRVLKPGGLLILETPNPENLVVGTSSFYLDPTHLRPIPPLLLAFLPEHHGFARVHTVRLQESQELHQQNDISLMDVLGGVSPDYAVVAQKAGVPEIMAGFDAAFATHYGIELNALSGRYDGTLQRRMSALDQRIANAEAQAGGMVDALRRITALQDRLLEANTQLTRLQEQEQRAAAAAANANYQQKKRIDELSSTADQLLQRAGVLEAERDALRQSASWRITAPLRVVLAWLQHFGLALRGGANRSTAVPGASVDSLQVVRVDALSTPKLDDLTPHARRIHADLQATIKNNRE